ncbi:MAG TPA: RidA family protein [Ktedonobacterales bacterium]|nr:RidA family protein [Ktedonobacterales bacterium]
MKVEAKLAERKLILPQPMQTGTPVKLPFTDARVRGSRVYISGHGPLNRDGTLAEPRGKVGRDVTLEEAYLQAQRTMLAILASLQRELGNLDRVTAWLRLFGMVNVAPGFNQTPAVINGASDLLLDLYGPEIGAHARSAVGMAELPFDIPVEIEAEVEIATR